MSDSPPPPPRVSVTLPEGGPTVTARLLRWVQTEDGTWQPEVALTIPAAAVTLVPARALTRRRPAGHGGVSGAL